MPHYDLYAALDLPRHHSASQLATEIDRRLQNVEKTPHAAISELTLARAVIGDPDRKELYDKNLYDPHAPDITVASLELLARTHPAPSAAPVTDIPSSGNEHRRRRRTAPILSLVTVIAVCAIGMTWMVTRSPSSENDQAQGYSDPMFTTGSPASEHLPESDDTYPETSEPEPTQPLPLPEEPAILQVRAATHDEDSDVCDTDACDRIVLVLNEQSTLKVRKGSGGNGTLQFILTGDNLDNVMSTPVQNSTQGHIEAISFQGGSADTAIMDIYTDGMSTNTSTMALENPNRLVIDIIR